MAKAIHIDAAKQEIREVECNSLADLQRLVGGYIETAYTWKTGDVMFVDEEGMLKAQEHFFFFEHRKDQPLAGNGVVVGPDRYEEAEDGEQEFMGQHDPKVTVAELQAQVRFVSREYADAWAKANASETHGSITYMDRSGKLVTETISRWGEFFRQMPKPPEAVP